jgi:hypothetical protein
LQVIDNTAVVNLRKWWNWQTHHLEGVAPKGVGVQIPPSAPESLSFEPSSPSGTVVLASTLKNAGANGLTAVVFCLGKF